MLYPAVPMCAMTLTLHLTLTPRALSGQDAAVVFQCAGCDGRPAVLCILVELPNALNPNHREVSHLP